MAVRFDAAADRLLRTANTPSTAADWTVTFWVYLTSDLNAFSTFMYIGTDNYSGDYHYVGTNADGTTILVDANGATNTGTNLSAATWYHIAIVNDDGGNNYNVYLDGVLDATVAVGLVDNTRWEFGAVGTNDTDRINGRISNIKRFDGIQLSTAQILQERLTYRPHFFGDNNGWYPTFPGSGERARDYGPNGYDFTEGGTLTDEDAPPISWGAPVMTLAAIAAAPAADALPMAMHYYRRMRS